MVSFTDVKTEINTEWGLAPGQANPTVYSKDIRFSTLYTDRIFATMYDDFPIKTWSVAGPATQQQIFNLNGVYATYALAKSAILELIRIFLLKGWRITGDGNIKQSGDKRYTFLLPCYANEILQA